MLLPVCLDPIQAWIGLKKSHQARLPHDSRFFLCFSFPSNLFPQQPAPLWPQAELCSTHWSLYCLVTWPQSSSPRGHGLAWGPVTARGYLSGTDSPIFTAIQQYWSPQPSPKLACPPLNHVYGTSLEHHSACPGINTGWSWQNRQTSTNWSTECKEEGFTACLVTRWAQKKVKEVAG